MLCLGFWRAPQVLLELILCFSLFSFQLFHEALLHIVSAFSHLSGIAQWCDMWQVLQFRNLEWLISSPYSLTTAFCVARICESGYYLRGPATSTGDNLYGLIAPSTKNRWSKTLANCYNLNENYWLETAPWEHFDSRIARLTSVWMSKPHARPSRREGDRQWQTELDYQPGASNGMSLRYVSWKFSANLLQTLPLHDLWPAFPLESRRYQNPTLKGKFEINITCLNSVLDLHWLQASRLKANDGLRGSVCFIDPKTWISQLVLKI